MSDENKAFSDFTAKQLEAHIHSIQKSIDSLTENIITLKAEYHNDKVWVHNLLKDHTNNIDKILDRLSRVEGRLSNGINDTITELKQAVAKLEMDLRELVKISREEWVSVEARLADKVKEEASHLSDKYSGLEGSFKDDKTSRRSAVSMVLLIIAQVITFMGLVYSLLSSG